MPNPWTRRARFTGRGALLSDRSGLGVIAVGQGSDSRPTAGLVRDRSRIEVTLVGVRKQHTAWKRRPSGWTGRLNIRVNAVGSGSTMTPMMMKGFERDPRLEEACKGVPIRWAASARRRTSVKG